MSQGKKYSDRMVNLIIAEYGSSGNYEEVGRTFGMPASTVKRICERNPAMLELAKEKALTTYELDRLDFKEQFLEKTTNVINLAMDLSQQRIALAIAAHQNYDTIIQDLITAMQKGGLDAYSVNDLIKSLSSIMSIPLKDLSTFIGTIYDKRALSNGEFTSRADIKGSLDTTNSNYQLQIEQRLTNDKDSAELVKQLFRRSGTINGTDDKG